MKLRQTLALFFAWSSAFGMHLPMQITPKKINITESISHNKTLLVGVAASFALGVCTTYFVKYYIKRKNEIAERAKWRSIVGQAVDTLSIGIHLSRDQKIEYIIDIVLFNEPGRCIIKFQDEDGNDVGFLTAIGYSIVLGSKSLHIACIDMLCVDGEAGQSALITLGGLAAFIKMFFNQTLSYGIRIINYRDNESLQHIGEQVGFVFEAMGDHSIGILNRDTYEQQIAQAAEKIEFQAMWADTQ